MIRIIVFLGTLAATSVAAWLLNIEYQYADLKAFLDVLLNVSGVVFTLMGIWIAFLYPNALARIVGPSSVITADFSEGKEEYVRLTAIVGSVLKSAFVVLVIMALNLARVIFPAIPIIVENLILIKQLALGFACMLFLIQSDAVMEVILANVKFLNDLHTKRASRQAEDEY